LGCRAGGRGDAPDVTIAEVGRLFTRIYAWFGAYACIACDDRGSTMEFDYFLNGSTKFFFGGSVFFEGWTSRRTRGGMW
jgi:hypothetical protein